MSAHAFPKESLGKKSASFGREWVLSSDALHIYVLVPRGSGTAPRANRHTRCKNIESLNHDQHYTTTDHDESQGGPSQKTRLFAVVVDRFLFPLARARSLTHFGHTTKLKLSHLPVGGLDGLAVVVVN
ncbi:hypothetical protein BV898_09189 [Hypsibius exemplaris]|uniref:Uncharacterized protein n=1 Tax=Hypsibius exemplaris TaxID=2072580 RepID=A0A1W0WNA4_HYPEX|nr:hypothetical protein BV898_09189 [Hypsibius exemplaris]